MIWLIDKATVICVVQDALVWDVPDPGIELSDGKMGLE